MFKTELLMSFCILFPIIILSFFIYSYYINESKNILEFKKECIDKKGNAIYMRTDIGLEPIWICKIQQ